MGTCDIPDKNHFIPDNPIENENLNISSRCGINIQNLDYYYQTGKNQIDEYGYNEIKNRQEIIFSFRLSNIRIHLCYSRAKERKKSLFINQIQIGKKSFPLKYNYGAFPIVEGEYLEKICFTSLEGLKQSYFMLNVYEYILGQDEKIKNLALDSNKLKTFIKSSKHCSYIQIDLLSFIYTSNKFNYAMKGKKPISTDARITFQMDLQQLCTFEIIVKKIKGDDNDVNKSDFIINHRHFNKKVGYDKDRKNFVIKTVPISINDLYNFDFYIQYYNNKDMKEFKYDSLNELKSKLLNDFSIHILNILKTIIFEGVPSNKAIKFNVVFPRSCSRTLDKYTLTINNLPIIFQAKNLIVTEEDYKYNASITYLFKKDENTFKYMKDKQCTYNEIQGKLKSNFDKLKTSKKMPKDKTMDLILYEIQEYLSKNFEENIYLYYYTFPEELINMLMLFMELGIRLIKILQKTNDQSKIVTILEILNILVKRDEFSNEIVFYCLQNFKNNNTNIEGLYNDFILYIFELNKIVKDKIKTAQYNHLVGIYVTLYFRNAMIRESILNSISLQVKDYEMNPIDSFLYETKYDDLINRSSEYLTDKTKDNINTNMVKTSEYFSNIIKEGYKLFIHKIFEYQNKQGLTTFPYDITLFNDNQILIGSLANYIKSTGVMNLDNDFNETVCLLYNSFFALKRINSIMITTINAYDSNCIYRLIDYLQNITEAYYKNENNILIMDYKFIEKAITIIVEIENSLNLPKIFWLYYCNGHCIPASNIKWLIKNVINPNMEKFLFSWSWKIRSLFMKLVLYILYDRLKYVNGKYLELGLIKKLMDKSNSDIKDSTYKEQGIKDFNAVYEEYLAWKKSTAGGGEANYPIIILNLAKNETID